VVLEDLQAQTLDVFAELAGSVEIRGGQYDFADLEAVSKSLIKISGKDFHINGLPAAFGKVPQVAGKITGTLSDGSPFEATFRRQFFPVADAAQIVLVPEPTAAALGACGLACAVGRRGRRRDGRDSAIA
jgi:hypothetical protein